MSLRAMVTSRIGWGHQPPFPAAGREAPSRRRHAPGAGRHARLPIGHPARRVGVGKAADVSTDQNGSGYVDAGQEYQRDQNYLPDRITADGSSGWPVEASRYRLVIARACPWANRAAIVRRLLGLEPVLSMGICGPTHDERSWTFDLDPGGRDPVLG